MDSSAQSDLNYGGYNNYPPPPVQTPAPFNIIKTPNPIGMWDSFEHILLFISLYVMASAIGLLLNTFVDKWFPLPVTPYAYYDSTALNPLVNGAVAALIVSTPIFSFIFLRIQKRTYELTEIRSLKSRRQLIYITLVVTFIIFISNVGNCIYNFLGGDLNKNALLHFLITFIISGFIFIYFLYQVREDRKIHA